MSPPPNDDHYIDEYPTDMGEAEEDFSYTYRGYSPEPPIKITSRKGTYFDCSEWDRQTF